MPVGRCGPDRPDTTAPARPSRRDRPARGPLGTGAELDGGRAPSKKGVRSMTTTAPTSARSRLVPASLTSSDGRSRDSGRGTASASSGRATSTSRTHSSGTASPSPRAVTRAAPRRWPTPTRACPGVSGSSPSTRGAARRTRPRASGRRRSRARPSSSSRPRRPARPCGRTSRWTRQVSRGPSARCPSGCTRPRAPWPMWSVHSARRATSGAPWCSTSRSTSRPSRRRRSTRRCSACPSPSTSGPAPRPWRGWRTCSSRRSVPCSWLPDAGPGSRSHASPRAPRANSESTS